jgi:hypothetical protein
MQVANNGTTPHKLLFALLSSLSAKFVPLNFNQPELRSNAVTNFVTDLF